MAGSQIIWLNLPFAKESMSHSWHLDFVGHRDQLLAGVNFWIDRSRSVMNHDRFQLLADCEMPRLKKSLSWQQITKHRVVECQSLLDQKPGHSLNVLWSGGLDSTMILASLILWLPESYHHRVQVCLTAASIWENPYFYREQIQPRWQCLDIQYQKKRPNRIYITGGMGDKLCYNELCVAWATQHGDFRPISKDLDKLLDFFTDTLGQRKKSETVWEIINQSAESRGVDIQYVSDALWWLGFNFGWQGMYLQAVNKDPELELCDIENQEFLQWYSNAEYQQWALDNYHLARCQDQDFVKCYKSQQKDIIYSVDHNDFYRNFKQKIPSTTRLFDAAMMSDMRLLAMDAHGIRTHADKSSMTQIIQQLGLA